MGKPKNKQSPQGGSKPAAPAEVKEENKQKEPTKDNKQKEPIKDNKPKDNKTVPNGKKPTEKKGGNGKFLISVFGIILLSFAIGLAVNFYKVSEKKLTLEEVVELQRQNPNDASLYCEEAKLLVKKKQLEAALNALEQCWEKKSSPTSHSLAISFVDTAKNIYQLNPGIFTSDKLTQYIIEASRGSDLPVGLFVAASIRSQEKKTEEALALLEETISYEIDSLAFARVVYYQYLQSLVNFGQFDKLKTFVEKLFNLRSSIAEEWKRDIQVLEYYSQAVIKTATTKEEVREALDTIVPLLKNIKIVPSNLTLSIIEYNVAKLYQKVEDNANTLEIYEKNWEKFWLWEREQNPACASSTKPATIELQHGKYLKHSDKIDKALVPSQRLKTVSVKTNTFDYVKEYSSKFKQEFRENEIEGFNIKDAQVQLSDRPNTLLVHTECQLVNYANTFNAPPPYTKKSLASQVNETIHVERAVVLHSRATTTSKWIYECLPKLNYLIDSQWLGEGGNLKLILPPTNYLGLFVELLKIESNVIWIFSKQVLNVESLLILDYNLPDASSALLDPISPISLLENLRFDLRGEDYSSGDLIVVIEPYSNNSTMLMLADRTIQNLAKLYPSLANLQVISLDTKAPPYNQIYAFKRVRVLISYGSLQVSNCLWMGQDASVIEYVPEPLEITTAAIITSQLGINYYPVAERHLNDRHMLSKLLLEILY